MTGEEFIFLSKHASGKAEALPQPVTDTEKKYVYGILVDAELALELAGKKTGGRK